MSKQSDVLIIDDEQVVIDAVVKICSAEGLKMDSAIDARIALNKLEKNTYRLIICDIMMPELDGFQFLEELLDAKINTPVIMTTGYSTVENAVRSLHDGAIDFIPKPFTADELVSSVYRGLRHEEILQKLSAPKSQADDTSFFCVPCPAKYYRLGYLSWVGLEDTGSALIGTTDMFLKTIETVGELELLKLDNEIVQGNSCAKIKSKDGLIHDILGPISGRIVERNEDLLTDLSIMEKDPYFEGWLYRIIPSETEYELGHLTSCSSDFM